MMRIYLTGFMGSGKSTAGRLVAEKLKIPFLDLDREIEQTLSTTIAQLFETHGEFYFRDQERELLHRITLDPIVVSTGGGCFIENTEWMKQNGIVIFLSVPFDVLASRLGADPSRPLWKNAQLLYAERAEHYKLAHHTIDGTGTPDEVRDRIIDLLLPEWQKTQEN
jgi:shikimate kinase